ncbi:hypothetical protein [Myroides indicus]|uniref:Uncharacterized protein n=1 Tax=Myroides indicus TaxID=1323422 RepID=A0A4R7EZZ2_9FLAO|nr:hypothetical protein [Myroides indicus]TDS62100.1 hypothetical protein C8P70_10769 [Myroides indicus]
MKKLFMFLAVAGLATFGVSCSSSDDSGNGGNGGDEKTLSLSADRKEIKEGESVTFTVKVGDKVESGAEFYIGSDKISNPHKFDAAGEYKVVAKKEGFKDSNAVTVKVTKEGVDPEPEAKLVLELDNEGTITEGDEVSFTVMNEKNLPVTDAVIYVNDKAITGTSFKTEAPGTYTAIAKKGDVESNKVSFEVIEFIPPSGDGTLTYDGVDYTVTQELLGTRGITEDDEIIWLSQTKTADYVIQTLFSTPAVFDASGNLIGTDPAGSNVTGYYIVVFAATGGSAIDFTEQDETTGLPLPSSNLKMSYALNGLNGEYYDGEVKYSATFKSGKTIKNDYTGDIIPAQWQSIKSVNKNDLNVISKSQIGILGKSLQKI